MLFTRFTTNLPVLFAQQRAFTRRIIYYSSFWEALFRQILWRPNIHWRKIFSTSRSGLLWWLPFVLSSDNFWTCGSCQCIWWFLYLVTKGELNSKKKFIMKICQSLPVGLHPAFPQGSSSRWLGAYHSPNPASIWLPSARSPAVGQHTGSCILGLLQLTARKAAASSRAKCPYSGDLKTHVP